MCNGRRRGAGAEPGRPLRRSVRYDAADGATGFSLCLLCFTGDRIVLLLGCISHSGAGSTLGLYGLPEGRWLTGLLDILSLW